MVKDGVLFHSLHTGQQPSSPLAIITVPRSPAVRTEPPEDTSPAIWLLFSKSKQLTQEGK